MALTQTVRNNVSPYTVSMEMRVSREIAMEMCADKSGSVYERNVFGTTYIFNPIEKSLTIIVGHADL